MGAANRVPLLAPQECWRWSPSGWPSPCSHASTSSRSKAVSAHTPRSLRPRSPPPPTAPLHRLHPHLCVRVCAGCQCDPDPSSDDDDDEYDALPPIVAYDDGPSRKLRSVLALWRRSSSSSASSASSGTLATSASATSTTPFLSVAVSGPGDAAPSPSAQDGAVTQQQQPASSCLKLGASRLSQMTTAPSQQSIGTASTGNGHMDRSGSAGSDVGSYGSARGDGGSVVQPPAQQVKGRRLLGWLGGWRRAARRGAGAGTEVLTGVPLAEPAPAGGIVQPGGASAALQEPPPALVSAPALPSQIPSAGGTTQAKAALSAPGSPQAHGREQQRQQQLFTWHAPPAGAEEPPPPLVQAHAAAAATLDRGSTGGAASDGPTAQGEEPDGRAPGQSPPPSLVRRRTATSSAPLKAASARTRDAAVAQSLPEAPLRAPHRAAANRAAVAVFDEPTAAVALGSPGGTDQPPESDGSDALL